MHRIHILAFASLLLGLMYFQNEPVYGTEYPIRTIKLIVPGGVGTEKDIVARVISEKLSKIIGQPIIIENSPGALGQIATSTLTQSKPDGYTLLLATSSGAVILPTLKRRPPFTERNFSPITLLVKEFHMLLVVRRDLSIASFSELVDYGHRHPGKLNLAYGGRTGYVNALVLKNELGVDGMLVSYRSTVDAARAILSGDVQAAFVYANDIVGNLDRIRPIACLCTDRSALMPEVPTLKEQHVDLDVSGGWAMLIAPGSTPRPIINILNGSVAVALADQDVIRRLGSIGIHLSGSDPEEASHWLAGTRQFWEAMGKKYPALIED
jgi:tripartite-type tricarboxylate transporter receptor subunit TctC